MKINKQCHERENISTPIKMQGTKIEITECHGFPYGSGQSIPDAGCNKRKRPATCTSIVLMTFGTASRVISKADLKPERDGRYRESDSDK